MSVADHMVPLDERTAGMLEGTLIAESLRSGTTLDGLDLTVRRIVRHTPGGIAEDQPAIWTNIDFEAVDEQAGALADALATMLAEPGWYPDFRSATETFVVFPHRIFCYPRGDATGRAEAQEHGRGLGIPEPQLDWPV
jgi:hypothetical protein